MNSYSNNTHIKLSKFSSECIIDTLQLDSYWYWGLRVCSEVHMVKCNLDYENRHCFFFSKDATNKSGSTRKVMWILELNIHSCMNKTYYVWTEFYKMWVVHMSDSLLVLMERSGNAQRFWTQCAAAMESLIAMSVSSARRYCEYTQLLHTHNSHVNFKSPNLILRKIKCFSPNLVDANQTLSCFFIFLF